MRFVSEEKPIPFYNWACHRQPSNKFTLALRLWPIWNYSPGHPWITHIISIPSGSKPLNALSHQLWYHFYPHICDTVSFLTNQLTVFSCAVKHMWFSVVWSFCESKIGFKFIIKWRQAEASLLDHRWGTDRIRRRTNANKQRKTTYDVALYKRFFQTSNPQLACLVQHLVFMDFHHKFWTSSFRNVSLALIKKMAPTIDPQVWDVFFRA